MALLFGFYLTDFDVIRIMDSVDRWPIVYSPQYNVKFYGFERFHPFDAAKWGNVIQVIRSDILNKLYDLLTVFNHYYLL